VSDKKKLRLDAGLPRQFWLYAAFSAATVFIGAVQAVALGILIPLQRAVVLNAPVTLPSSPLDR
jgi:hypothetical protein